jgi:hypothetical protein
VEKVDHLISVIDQYLAGEKSIEAIEEATTPFIVDDENALKDAELSRIVYQLDMHDVENLTEDKVRQLRGELVAYKQNQASA